MTWSWTCAFSWSLPRKERPLGRKIAMPSMFHPWSSLLPSCMKCTWAIILSRWLSLLDDQLEHTCSGLSLSWLSRTSSRCSFTGRSGSGSLMAPCPKSSFGFWSIYESLLFTIIFAFFLNFVCSKCHLSLAFAFLTYVTAGCQPRDLHAFHHAPLDSFFLDAFT